MTVTELCQAHPYVPDWLLELEQQRRDCWHVLRTWGVDYWLGYFQYPAALNANSR